MCRQEFVFTLLRKDVAVHTRFLSLEVVVMTIGRTVTAVVSKMESFSKHINGSYS